MKGGTFTIHQLMNLFNIFTKNQDYKTTFDNIEILNESKYLYNNQFHVYVLFNRPTIMSESQIKKDMESVRIIAIHRGTMGPRGFRTRKQTGLIDNISRFFGSVKDWTNNARNIASTFKNKKPKTYRQERAKKGHDEMRRYLYKLMRQKPYKTNYMKLLLHYCLQNGVSSFLKERLSTLGFSQGAIYAYLYGGEGKETIVYNPAPFHGKKPANTFILKTKNDLVSYFVNNDELPITVKDTNKFWFNITENHTNDVLLGDNEKIGTGIFTES
jgi:hypothetical protein